MNLTKALNRVSNEHHIHALVIAAMIVHQLGMKFAQVVGHRVGRARLSYERLYHVLTSHLIGVVDMAGLEKSDQDLDARHVTRDKRSRFNSAGGKGAIAEINLPSNLRTTP